MPSPLADSFTQLFIGYDIYHVDERVNAIGNKYKKAYKKLDSNGENTIFLYSTLATKLRFDISQQIDPDEPDFPRGTVPSQIYLTNETVKWDFGDGATGAGLIVDHVFDKPGVYYVKATARDFDGRPRESKYKQKIVVSDFVKTDVKWVSPGNKNKRLDLIPAGQVSDYFDIYSTTPWRFFLEDENHTLSVYASGSSSEYLDPDDYLTRKYAHFENTWRFTTSPESITPIKALTTPTNAIVVTFAYIEIIQNNKPTGLYDIVYVYTSKSPMDLRTGSFPEPDPNYNVLHSSQLRQYMIDYDGEIAAAYRPGKPTEYKYVIPPLTSDDWIFVGHESITRVCYMDDVATMYLSQQSITRKSSAPVFLFASLDVSNVRVDTFNDQPESILNIEPNVEQWHVDALPVGIVYNPPTDISITANGIQSIKINSLKLKDTVITLNTSLVDPTGLNILKSKPNKSICPSGNQLYSVDIKLLKHENDQVTPMAVDFKEISLPLETPGSCSMYLDNISTTGNYQLSANCRIKDDIYMNKQVESYFVANMHSDHIFVFRPGYMDHQYTFMIDHTIKSEDFDTTVTTLEQPVRVLVDPTPETALTHFFAMSVDSEGAAWIADTDRDLLIKLDRFGNHTDTILVENPTGNNDEITTVISPKDPASPYGFVILPDSDKSAGIASISTDEYNNIWVALADADIPTIVKITEDGSHDKPYMSISIDLPGYNPSRLYPSKIETDRENNVWVSLLYSQSHIDSDYQPDTFVIVKFDSLGNRLIDPITFDYLVHIHDIIVDGHNDIWVTNSKPTTFDNKGSLIHISESGEILNQIFDYTDPHTNQTVVFDKPSQLTLDMYDHLWVVHAGNTLVKIKTGDFESPAKYTILDTRTVGPSWEDDPKMIQLQGRRHAIEGFSSDTDDRILVVNNVDKKFYMFISNNTDLNTKPGNYAEDPIQLDSKSEMYKKDTYEVTQAFGDWTGVRWIQKYYKYSNTIRSLSGVSDIFTVTPGSEVQKINEDIDLPDIIESISYQSVLNESTTLQSKLFRPVLGDATEPPENIGKTLYEKTSNFAKNTIDVDTCNIDHLYSLSNSVVHTSDDYRSVIPAKLKRKLNLLSTSYDKLKGSRDQTEEQLNNQNYISTFNIGRNLGEKINPESYIVKAGLPIVSLELFNENYRVIVPMTIQNPELPSSMDAALYEYPLRLYDKSWGWRLSYPEDESFMKYYDFFHFTPNTTREFQTNLSEYSTVDSKHDKDQYNQLEGLIDWNNPLTTVEEDTTLNNWSKSDTSNVNMLFEKTLREGLKIDE